ncbi:GDSL-type esterase/lipase family protein [Flavobacteriaceae bacterium F89]|uniref:GDSL-type esterase/lipase family protein n=1 Tax=Cerina litoralis TaxID=2874477 RepID=A0AAE3JNH5_9FLAO|nr:GDSL-type esterase/lipase family protein [Cerina litoralis]MCG2459884.1 GDSL-type esterase/lipase family protein [Cerina litoralis]
MKKIVLTLIGLSCLFTTQAQQNFKKEVEGIQKKYESKWDRSKPTIVFTGSSSIRMWKDVQQMFPGHQIINTGFGGSQTSDLLYYVYDLIYRYHPKKVFIYEGDNDIAAGKSIDVIMAEMEELVRRINEFDPIMEIVLISPKPSIARWDLKGKYQRLNKKLKQWTDENPQLQYVDIWDVMVVQNKLNRDIFLEDGLHMNAKGYALWYNALKSYVN